MCVFTHEHCQWLEEDFLSYVCNWEEAVKSSQGDFTKTQQKMLLSKETIEGLKFTST